MIKAKKKGMCMQAMVQTIILILQNADASLVLFASQITTDDVAAFLTEIELSEYVEDFKDCKISGKDLLEFKCKTFSDMDVDSPLHQMKIMQLFRRKLQGSIDPRYSTEHLCHFLEQNDLEQYTAVFQENGIDGDMILEVDKDLMVKVLTELQIPKKDIRKIRVCYETYCK